MLCLSKGGCPKISLQDGVAVVGQHAVDHDQAFGFTLEFAVKFETLTQ